MSIAVPLVLATGAEGAVGILWKAVQFGFATVVVVFLLGIVCALVGNIRDGRRGEWRQ